MSRSPDAVIIGAGIVGSACAWELARTGLSVLVLEQEMVGGGATAAGMGHVVIMDDSPEQFNLTRLGRELWREIAPQLPDDCEYDPCGTLWLAENEEQMETVASKQGRYRADGVACEILGESELRALEPNLKRGLPGALLVPQDMVIYAPCAARCFLQRALEFGASLRAGVRAVELREDGIVLQNGEKLACGWSIIAAGSLSVKLLPDLPLRPRRGHLVITDRYPGYIKHQLVEVGYLESAHAIKTDSVALNLQPRLTGQILIGSSREFDREERSVQGRILGDMMRRAVDFMPGIEGLHCIRSWTGVRAATPDNLPLIGPHPTISNLVMATGHEGLGITTSLATGRLLAQSLRGEDSAIPLKPFLPSRLEDFSWAVSTIDT